jgi:hypothetical protein
MTPGKACGAKRLVHLAGGSNPLGDHVHATSGLPFIVQRKGLAIVALK